MLPLMIAQAALGGYSAWNKFQQGKSAQDVAEKARKRLDAMMSENRQDQTKATQQATADATDMRTNYITARDPNKAQGLAQMYQSGMNNFRNTIAGLKQENRALQAQREGIESPTNAEIYGGVATDLASTAANMYGSYKAGQQADLTQHNQTQFMKLLSDPMHKYQEFAPMSFSDQIKNMFSSSKSTSDIVDSWKAPSIEIAEMPEKPFSRSTYKSSAPSFLTENGKFNDGLPSWYKKSKWITQEGY